MKLFLASVAVMCALATPSFAAEGDTPAVHLVQNSDGKVLASTLIAAIQDNYYDDLNSCLYECQQDEYMANYECSVYAGIGKNASDRADDVYDCEQSNGRERGGCEQNCYYNTQPPEPVPA